MHLGAPRPVATARRRNRAVAAGTNLVECHAMTRIFLIFMFSVVVLAIRAPSAYAGCGSDSDCAGNGRCSNGTCGNCGSDSDCHGNGRCSSGKCGACGSDSDCRIGQCSNGRCGRCGSDSDCRGNGRCSNGRCGSCGSDSDCKIGRCSSGKCGACGSDSDCKGGRCSSGRCSNATGAGYSIWDIEIEACSASPDQIRATMSRLAAR